ncbi:MAG TPA: acetylornithine deacetylase [bacterium]|nr:acetylornithine deacetylase [bacterium]
MAGAAGSEGGRRSREDGETVATARRPAWPWARALDAALAARREELFELTGRLIAFETPCPPGRNTGPIQAFLAERLRALDAEVRMVPLYPGDSQLVALLAGRGGSGVIVAGESGVSRSAGGRSLLLNGHVDVASTAPDEPWTAPPFRPLRRDGRLYGRGATDMKGGIAAALVALEAVVATLGRPRGNVVAQFVTGEEMGEAGTLTAIEHTPPADLALVLEPSSGEISLGQGGVVTGWITIQSPETFHDAMRRRMIHAGGGVRGASAIEKMVVVLHALQALERHWAVAKSHPGFAPGTTTINPAVIEGGRHPAFVADRCALWITVHFYPGETMEGVTREIEAAVRAAAAADPWLRDHPPAFRWGGRSMIEDRGEVFPAFETPADHPGTMLVAQAHADVCGAAPAYRASGGVCDAGWLAERGIPAVVYGPGGWGQAHAVDEYVALDDLVRCARVYARVIAGWTDAAG